MQNRVETNLSWTQTVPIVSPVPIVIPDFNRKPAHILENVPSPVLAKSPTGIGQIANQYWQNRQLVLAKLPTGIGQIANRYWPNRKPVFAKSPTVIRQIAYRY